MVKALEVRISELILDSKRNRATYPCRYGPISNSYVIDTDLMYSIGYVYQIGGENKIRIYPSRPWRMVCLRSGYVPALHTVHVDLCHFTTRSGGIDLDCLCDLVTIHWLREMELKLYGFCRGQTIVVPWKKLGDHWSGSYIFRLRDKYFVAPSSKRELGKATGKSLFGVIV